MPKSQPCAFRTLDPQICQLINYDYSNDPDCRCPYYRTQLPTCERCGAVDPQGYLTQISSSWKYLCRKCAVALSSCACCTLGVGCCYDSDPSPLPKVIQKTTPQGLTIQTRNPEREAITCAQRCGCWDPDTQTCNRNATYCRNYKLLEF